jgi:hypothetical protein
LTLDPDVAAKTKKGAAALRKPLTEVINAALRVELDEVQHLFSACNPALFVSILAVLIAVNDLRIHFRVLLCGRRLTTGIYFLPFFCFAPMNLQKTLNHENH